MGYFIPSTSDFQMILRENFNPCSYQKLVIEYESVAHISFIFQNTNTCPDLAGPGQTGLVRSQKLSRIGTCQCLDGRLLRKSTVERYRVRPGKPPRNVSCLECVVLCLNVGGFFYSFLLLKGKMLKNDAKILQRIAKKIQEKLSQWICSFKNK